MTLISYSIHPDRARQKPVVWFGFFLLAFLAHTGTSADETQKPIYLELAIDSTFGVNNQSVIEEDLANMIAGRLTTEYPYWTFVSRDLAARDGVANPMPYVDLSFKYDDTRENVIFSVQFHVSAAKTLPDENSDSDKWQVVVLAWDALLAGIPQGKAAWREMVDSSITILKAKSKGEIRKEIENYVPLGTANFEQVDDKIFATLASGDLHVRNVVRWDFRVCCVESLSDSSPTLLFADGILFDDTDAPVVRIKTTYDRTCKTPCNKKCGAKDDDQSHSVAGLQRCYFWLDREPDLGDWL